jgi:hypothetical protein
MSKKKKRAVERGKGSDKKTSFIGINSMDLVLLSIQELSMILFSFNQIKAKF